MKKYLVLCTSVIFMNPAFSLEPQKTTIQQAKQIIIKSSKDPSSVRFGEVFKGHDKTGKERFICGYVNAKNSYGGYTGMKKFGIYNGEIAFSEESDGAFGANHLFQNYCIKKQPTQKAQSKSTPKKGAVTHTHNGRPHQHPLPSQGKAHKHGNGAIGK